jgi:hypothetical protein
VWKGIRRRSGRGRRGMTFVGGIQEGLKANLKHITVY